MLSKHRLLFTIAIQRWLSCGVSVLTAEDYLSTPSLTIGSKAPELNVEH